MTYGGIAELDAGSWFDYMRDSGAHVLLEYEEIADDLGAIGWNPNVNQVLETPASVERMHDAGLSTNVYTVNSASQWSELTALSVDGIITDYSDHLQRWNARLQQLGAKPAPEPTESEPAEPEPSEPAPTVPEPTEPHPTEPEPTEPEPSETGTATPEPTLTRRALPSGSTLQPMCISGPPPTWTNPVAARAWSGYVAQRQP